MSEELLNKIRLLVEKHMGKYKFMLERTTALEKDLGVSGDDAVELMLEYSKFFNVDLSKFDISIYFFPEGDTFFPDMMNSLTGKRNPKQKELTLGDLEKGILEGKLDETVIGHNKANT